jgi:hypothetical protein
MVVGNMVILLIEVLNVGNIKEKNHIIEQMMIML